MIDLNLYRYRVGVFNNCKSCSGSNTVSITGNFGTDARFLNISKLIVYLCLYLYYALCVLGMVIGMITECELTSFSLLKLHRVPDIDLCHHCFTNVKLFSAILFCFLAGRDLRFYRFFGFFCVIFSKMYFGNLASHNNQDTKSCLVARIVSNLKTIITGCLLWILSLNSILIIIVNPSLLNPGPLNSLTVTSFNLQGLLPIFFLFENPRWGTAKGFENSYIQST